MAESDDTTLNDEILAALENASELAEGDEGYDKMKTYGEELHAAIIKYVEAIVQEHLGDAHE